MKRSILSFLILTLFLFKTNSQDSLFQPYQPDADAKLQIGKALEAAKAENKHVLIMIGGNWCKWCIRLTKYMAEHEAIDSLIKADFAYIHVNYSKENKNPEIMKQFEYPQRFGFPVFVILDEKGKRLHTQNTVYLEKDETYNEEVIIEFLLNWNYRALHPIE